MLLPGMPSRCSMRAPSLQLAVSSSTKAIRSVDREREGVAGTAALDEVVADWCDVMEVVGDDALLGCRVDRCRCCLSSYCRDVSIP